MRVLVVDDEVLVRRGLERLLVRHGGHEVVLAENGRQGLELWRASNFDLVMLDVAMPGLSGPQVLEAIGEKKSGRVVLMSAFAGEHNRKTTESLGGDLFIAKPFDNIMGVLSQVEELCRVAQSK